MNRPPASSRLLLACAAAAVWLGLGVSPADARQVDTTAHPVLRAVYGMNGPAATAVFGRVDRSSLWVVFGAPPALGVVRAVSGGRYGDAWRAGLSVAGATIAFKVLKHAVRRERPFRTVEGIVAREGFVGSRSIDRYAFPSGHATLAAALATSLALDHSEWVVTVPAVAWAASVGVSRVWLGVHFPGDVVAGWALGGVLAWGVHRARKAVTPDGWDGPDPSAGAAPRVVLPPVVLRF